MSGYDEYDDAGELTLDYPDTYDDEVWLEHRENAELEHFDRLLRHGGLVRDLAVEARREAA